MRHRRIALALTAAALLVAASRHPSATINILTHDRADPAPQRFQAAVDLGLVAISVLITWSADRLA